MEISSFKSIVKNYKVVFFDAFGVLKNSSGMLKNIHQTFEYLTANNIAFYILTNDASRGPKMLAKSYQDAGLDMINENKIISSGMLAREYLRLKVNSGTVAYLGTKQSAHYLEETGLKALSIADLDINDIDEVNALVFLDDEGFDWRSDLNKLGNLLRLRNIPVIVANTDKSYPVSDTELAIAIGSIADMMEKITGRKFIKFGKPDSNMFIYAYNQVAANKGIEKNEILMVGDTLFTDIIGGNKFGIDTALVLTGNTHSRYYNERIQGMGIIPDYVCESAVIEK